MGYGGGERKKLWGGMNFVGGEFWFEGGRLIGGIIKGLRMGSKGGERSMNEWIGEG